jgi:hypothetical protein
MTVVRQECNNHHHVSPADASAGPALTAALGGDPLHPATETQRVNKSSATRSASRSRYSPKASPASPSLAKQHSGAKHASADACYRYSTSQTTPLVPNTLKQRPINCSRADTCYRLTSNNSGSATGKLKQRRNDAVHSRCSAPPQQPACAWLHHAAAQHALGTRCLPHMLALMPFSQL